MPNMKKTGTTICGVVFEVRLLLLLPSKLAAALVMTTTMMTHESSRQF